ncbi:MAG: cell division protein PerM [Bifidobacterium asteroides]
MTDRVKAWLRGALEAFLAILIYTVALGACMALLLLMISIEEGGPSLSMATVALTETITLLTQGCGFTAGALTLTIIPLLLTGLLIWVIRSLVGRMGMSVGGCIAGLVVWMLCSLILMQGSQTIQADTSPVILLRTSLVFLLGYGWAWARSEPFRQAFARRIKEALPIQVRRTIRLGLTAGLMLLAAMLAAGLIALIVWIALYHADVGRLFKLTRMGTASAVTTSLASLAWLPNLIIWAASWLFGDGFKIGQLATFTLWSGHASSLPSLPIFGLFPEPVSRQEVRMLLLNLPLLFGVVAGVLLLTGPWGVRILAAVRQAGLRSRDTAVCFLMATLAMVLVWLVTLLGLALLFQLSNGALGRQRLAGVGVPIASSVRMIGTSLGVGLLGVWLLSLVIAALAIIKDALINYLRQAVDKKTSAKAENEEKHNQSRLQVGKEPKATDRADTPRQVSSTRRPGK